MDLKSVTDTFQSLLAAELSKIIAISALFSIVLCIGIVIVAFQIQTRRGKKETYEGQVQLGLVQMASSFVAEIQALRSQMMRDGDLNRQTLSVLTEAYKSHTVTEEEQRKMQRQIADRFASSIDTNTEGLHAHTKTIGQLELAVNDLGNSITTSSRLLATRIDSQAESLAALIGDIRALPKDVGAVIGQKVDEALTEFLDTKKSILGQFQVSEDKMVKALQEVQALLKTENKSTLPVPSMVPDSI